MGTTRQLQDELKLLLGSNNVYFQPPKNLQMHYPCFTVSLGSASQAMADNKTYTYTEDYPAFHGAKHITDNRERLFLCKKG